MRTIYYFLILTFLVPTSAYACQKDMQKEVTTGNITVVFNNPVELISSDNGNRYVSYSATKMHTIINFEGDLFINEKYVGFFSGETKVNYDDWIISKDRKFISKKIQDELKKKEHTKLIELAGMMFEIECLLGGDATSITDDENFVLDSSGIYIEVIKGRLVFRGHDYGPVEKGMKITWKDGLLSKQ